MNALLSHWPSLLLLALSAVPAAYMVLHDTGKVKWFGRRLTGFFGEKQWLRKYKKGGMYRVEDPGTKTTPWILERTGDMPLTAPDNWYYRFFKVKYEEAFPFSATFLVTCTDCYHASQALMRILMSLSITLAIGAPWWAFIAIWTAYATLHALTYKLLSK